jgi:hypothetical protein
MTKRYGLSWLSERVHLDSLDDEPYQALWALAAEEGMSLGDYVVQYGRDGHLYTFSDIKGEVRLTPEEEA